MSFGLLQFVQTVPKQTLWYLDGITGEYEPPQGYLISEEEAAEFDTVFPYKEKLKLPGQLFD